MLTMRGGGLVGVVAPCRDPYPNVTWWSAQLYARAIFDDGSALTFGPRVYRRAGGGFHMEPETVKALEIPTGFKKSTNVPFFDYADDIR
jgi:hypothetical protein